MANNRMWLQIKGQPKKTILLAKYYPGTGWYIFHTEDKLNEWFGENFDIPDQGDWVDNQWGRVDLELVFETSQKELEKIRTDLKNKKENRNDTERKT